MALDLILNLLKSRESTAAESSVPKFLASAVRRFMSPTALLMVGDI